VQTTSTPTLGRNWTRWRPVILSGVDPVRVDLYFFAVQTNPVDPQMLMALFPLSEPPWACIAAAFSLDGITFSAPINLYNSRVGFREHTLKSSLDRFLDSKLRPGFAARAEDHPVAGIVADPRPSGDAFLIYIHHGVRGTSYRDDEPHVTGYRITVATLRSWSASAKRELDWG
jgi:hypothetical protein